jgi:hypothetical protein
VPLVVVTVVLFVVATAGGFALTRTIGGQPLAPPEQATTAAPRVSTLPETLEARTADATNLKGARGGSFSVQVPKEWTKFVTQRQPGKLPASTVVQFVSIDGRQTLDVERFADYYTSGNAGRYVDSLAAEWPPGDFVLVSSAPLSGGRDGIELTYRTLEHGPAAGGGALSRTTFAQAFRVGGSLWVVGVTVPTEQEDVGKPGLFDRIVPTFTTT